ncbi:hypothetical protein L0F63_000089 [Massospora cicadina]|nr:hypothetical protein L0F63_000089 [Massospora cicadina]
MSKGLNEEKAGEIPNGKLNASLHPEPISQPKTDEEVAHALKEHVAAIASKFELTTAKLQFIQEKFIEAMRYGLSHTDGELAMIPTFVTRHPTGQETGNYFAIDLGGSNLRVCLVRLLGPEGGVDVKQQKSVIPDTLKSEAASYLFDFVACNIENFLKENHLEPADANPIPLGFTFSFPVDQIAINRGKLIMWNKGFTCPGAVDMDIVQLLQDALDRRQLNIKVAALVNDTVGTLLASAYLRPNTLAGVIFGTGTNAAYYEKLSEVTKWKGDLNVGDEMILNTEWGNFDTQKRVIPFTVFDHRLDRASQNPYTMGLEKMISGRYLGELVRHVIVDLIDHQRIFNGRSTPALNTPYQFRTSYMSRISADPSAGLDDARQILESNLGLPSTTQFERECVRDICNFVARRSARLSATILSGLCAKRCDLDTDVTVGIDGSLFANHPSFTAIMKSTLIELMGEAKANRVHLALARDGSGIGAALTAMIASH